MKTRGWLSGLAVLSIIVGACGSTTKAKIHTPQELGAALLTTSDLGTGWSEQQRDVFTTRAPENPSIDASLWCPDAAAQAATLQTLPGQTGADVELQLPQSGVTYQGLRQQAWSNTDATTYFKTISAAVKTCSGKTWTEPEGKYTIGSLVGPKVGSESATWTVDIVTSGPRGDMVSRSHLTVARFGSTVMVLQQGDLILVAAQSQPAGFDWQAVLQKAATKMATLDTK